MSFKRKFDVADVKKLPDVRHPTPSSAAPLPYAATSPKAATCNRCGESIYWVRWPKSGKWMAIDAEAHAGGDIVISFKSGWMAFKWFPGAATGKRKRYQAHNETCLYSPRLLNPPKE